jgi:pyrimidine-nucleoside phosphorylase
MRAYELIQRKRDGGRLSGEEIRALIAAYTAGEIPDYQVAALLMAVFFRGLDAAELSAWTDAKLRSGEVLDLSDVPGVKVDKHSTGGVGDKISLPLAPLVAACGVPVPMISGRGLGHTGGTLDKLESIPGFRVDLPPGRFRRQVAELGCCLIGQTATIAPADKKLYALRDATATVESIPLISSSILSKKLAEGIDALVLDVKVGRGAFMKRREDARLLARTMVGIGEAMGKRVVALLTAMDEPLGRTVGNALEVRESLDVLRGGGPADVVELTVRLGAEMLVLGGVARDLADGELRVRRAIADGSGLARFRAIVAAQGGDVRAIDDPSRLPAAPRRVEVPAPRDGFVAAIDSLELGHAAVALGAGRARKEDAVDPGVGFELLWKAGDPVRAGEPIARIHAPAAGPIDATIARVAAAYRFEDAPPSVGPLVLERITTGTP